MNLKHIFLPWLVIRELERKNTELTGRVTYEQSTVTFLNEEIADLRASNERLFDRVGVLERHKAELRAELDKTSVKGPNGKFTSRKVMA